MGPKLLINNTDELYLWSHGTPWMAKHALTPSYPWILVRLGVGKTRWPISQKRKLRSRERT